MMKLRPWKAVAPKVEVSDATYEALLAIKGDRETVSDVVDRLTRDQALDQLVGSMSEEDAEHYRRAIDERRERIRRERQVRHARLFGRAR